MKKSLFAGLLLTTMVTPALAEIRTLTLKVDNMTCEVCPITVKKALQKVPGVTVSEVSLERKEARVSFDDTKATLNNVLDATFEAGYPSEVIGDKAK